MEEMIKLTNGKKTIIRSKIQYEANIKHFEMRGFKVEDDKPKQEHKINFPKDEPEDMTYENETKVVQLKPKKKKKKAVKK